VGDEPIPGCVEVDLELAYGTVAKLFDKPAVLTPDDRLRPDSAYLVVLQLACESASTDAQTCRPETRRAVGSLTAGGPDSP
jgi:hypothetical protein